MKLFKRNFIWNNLVDLRILFILIIYATCKNLNGFKQVPQA